MFLLVQKYAALRGVRPAVHSVLGQRSGGRLRAVRRRAHRLDRRAGSRHKRTSVFLFLAFTLKITIYYSIQLTLFTAFCGNCLLVDAFLLVDECNGKIKF